MKTNIKRTLMKAGMKLKKHSPEILMGLGIAGTVTSTVLACKATLKIDDVLVEPKETIKKIHNAVALVEAGEELDYSIEDSKKDLTITYVQTGLKIAKLYAPAVIMGGLSIASMLTAHNIMRKRNLALGATCAALTSSFNDYRANVVERFGKDMDNELRYNIKAGEIEEKTVNEKGKEKTTKKKVEVSHLSHDDQYTRVFDASNVNWENCMDYNDMFLRGQEAFANERLKAAGYLFLNDVLKDLGFEPTKVGQVVGWVYDDLSDNDGYVDFNIHKTYIPDENGTPQPGYTLEFNVDGDILDLM